MPISQNYHILCRNKTNVRTVEVVMTHIDEREESFIDNLKDNIIKLDRGERTFTISRRQIYCYGEVDFNNEEDLKTIDGFKFLSHLGVAGQPIYANHNYHNHTCASPKNHALWTETWSPAYLARYAHASLNKPQRIILFYQDIK